MTTDEITIEAVAGEAYGWFTTTKRGEDTITVLKDDAPEWVTDLVHEAHGDFLPDDWRYDAIRAAVGSIHDDGDYEDNEHEFADGYVDVYNSARFAWLASNLQRQGYVDEATDEFGHSDQGVTGDIGMGQYLEAREVYVSVKRSLEARVEELQDEQEEGE